MEKLLRVGLLGLVLFTANLAFADNYKIDSDHSRVTFKVKHMGISNVSGVFKEFSGNFSFDPEKVAESVVEANIVVGSINTENTKRDDHLRSDEFLNQPKFPQISFKSKAIKDVSGSAFTIVGDLTIAGVTKEVALSAEHPGIVKDPWGNTRAGFEATVQLNRKDFGLTWNKLLEAGGLVVGEEVKVGIEIEGIKQ